VPNCAHAVRTRYCDPASPSRETKSATKTLRIGDDEPIKRCAEIDGGQRKRLA